MERQFVSLLDEFRKLPPGITRSPTFMEVAGYPHYENVCSNILAFFLDPKNQHGFEGLFLDALAEAGPIDGITEGSYANVSVERESTTDRGNRIDILIESDTWLIVIENKIFHGVANPFEDYTVFVNQRNTSGKPIYKFLLTLDRNDTGTVYGFRNLTYSRFIDAIRHHIRYHAAHAETRYLVMLIEFLNTLENLQMETYMDPQFVGLLDERSDEVVALLEEVDRFKGELRTKVTELGALINPSQWPNVKQSFYREKGALFDDLVHDIHISYEVPIRIDTEIRPRGWEISIWFFRGNNQERLRNLSGDQTKLRSLLQSLSIPFDEGEKFIYQTCFAYTEPLERLQPVVQDLIEKIAGTQ